MSSNMVTICKWHFLTEITFLLKLINILQVSCNFNPLENSFEIEVCTQCFQFLHKASNPIKQLKHLELYLLSAVRRFTLGQLVVFIVAQSLKNFHHSLMKQFSTKDFTFLPPTPPPPAEQCKVNCSLQNKVFPVLEKRQSCITSLGKFFFTVQLDKLKIPLKFIRLEINRRKMAGG